MNCTTFLEVETCFILMLQLYGLCCKTPHLCGTSAMYKKSSCTALLDAAVVQLTEHFNNNVLQRLQRLHILISGKIYTVLDEYPERNAMTLGQLHLS